MKKSLFLALAALACFVSCTKEETSPVCSRGTLKINVTGQIGDFQDSGTKADIVNSVRVGWTGSERVYVYDGSEYLGFVDAPATIEDSRVAELSGEINAPAEGHSTLTFIYSSTFTGQPSVSEGTITVDLSAQTEKIPFVIYGKAECMTSGISNLVVPFKFATSAVKVSVTDLEPSVAISKSCLLGANTQCVLTLGEAGTVTVAGAAPGAITRTETSKKASESGYAFVEMGVPVSAANKDRIVAVYQNGIHLGRALLSSITASRYVNSIAKLPAVANCGVFSVSSTTKVRFSNGNLQYLGTGAGGTLTPQWRFAEHQYDVMGDGPLSATQNKGNVMVAGYNTYNSGSLAAGGSETAADKQAARDLFGWGTTGFKDTRSSAFQTNYQPYSTSTSSVDNTSDAYGINNFGYGPDYNVSSQYGLTVASKSDWGYCIGGETSLWRTLSKDEWAYLLNVNGTSGRSDDCRFAKANVYGVNGLVVFPDGYAGTDSADGIAEMNSRTADFPETPVTSATWLSMESAGCAFLPMTGMRTSSAVGSVSVLGGYWSSTVYGVNSAYRLYFSNTELNPMSTSTNRYVGQSVRLVTSAL